MYKKGKFSAIEEHQIEEALQKYANIRSLSPADIDAIIFSKGKKAKEEYSTFWSEISMLYHTSLALDLIRYAQLALYLNDPSSLYTIMLGALITR